MAWIAQITPRERVMAPDVEVELFEAADLMPIVGICAVSLLLSAVWLAAVWQYARSRAR
jgi:hypothetical protein